MRWERWQLCSASIANARCRLGLTRSCSWTSSTELTREIFHYLDDIILRALKLEILASHRISFPKDQRTRRLRAQLDLWQLKVDGKFSHWKCHRLLLVIRHRVVVLVAADFTATSARDKKEKNHLQQLPGLHFALPMWMTYILNDERRPRAHIVFFAYLNYISRNTYFVPSSFAFCRRKKKHINTRQRNESQSQCARGARWNGKLWSQKMCNTSTPAKYEKLNVSEHHHQRVASTLWNWDSPWLEPEIFIYISAWADWWRMRKSRTQEKTLNRRDELHRENRKFRAKHPRDKRVENEKLSNSNTRDKDSRFQEETKNNQFL